MFSMLRLFVFDLLPNYISVYVSLSPLLIIIFMHYVHVPTGLRNASIRPIVIIVIIIVRYVFLPLIGIGVIRAAAALGLLPSDPLFKFVLLIQFTVPPAMNISTMTQLFDVGQEECSVLTMWTYIVAAFALTGWSTVFMSILT
ncbi:putative membrane transport protein [Helianthus annuus]|nr:putative membrane transport protein [Helianthus annuus]KAJ0445555.1 putative membrane transport protein [Helianthus annuus]KAJ0462603.1 putative membrane transport protein [Helianthus annuus]